MESEQQKEKQKKGLLSRALMWVRGGSRLKWLSLGLLVGVVSGLAAAGFFYLLELSKHFTFNYLAHYPISAPAGERLFESAGALPFRRWVFFLLPLAGGLISGLIVYSLAPEAEGDGTDAMIKSFHQQDGRIRLRVPFVKAAGAIATLASGGSAGREGPITQIGAGLGAAVADFLKLSARDRRIFLLAGAGGGLGAIFRAPLGGAIAACEIIYQEDLETDALIPTVISSITAYTIYSLIFGFQPIFDIPDIAFNRPTQLLLYAGLGVVCFPLGLFYIRAYYFCLHRLFRNLKIPRHLKPMLGGLGVALIGLKFPQVYGDGWGQIQLALWGKIAVGTMAGIVLFKMLATSLTLGSGGSGGVFGPTLFIGGMIGGVAGHFAHQFYPQLVSAEDISAFVLVGMAGFFAGVAHAPLGALLMVTEMTQGYHLIAPLLLVSAIAILLNRRFSIYQNQVHNKFKSPAHVGEFTVNVLEEMTVDGVYEKNEYMNKIPASAKLKEILMHIAYDEAEIWPVVKDDGTIIGVLSLDTTKPILFEEGMDDILIAEDLAIPAAHVHPSDSLYQALVEFLRYPISAILVTDEKEPNKVLGVLRHRDLIQAYNNEILRRKAR